MPITRQQFDKEEFIVRQMPNTDYVQDFLKENSNKAFRAEEIAEILNKSGSIIRRYLQRLLKDGLIERKSPYYIWKDETSNEASSANSRKIIKASRKKAKKKRLAKQKAKKKR